jgi:membrane-associated phospholipid phosphatase
MFFFATVIYLLSNHFPITPPRLLPMGPIDRWVPLLPNSVWIYISEWLFFFVTYVTARDLKNVNMYIYSFISLQIVSGIIFVMWPTTYPRDAFPLPDDLNALTYYAFSGLRNIDTPGNCCPSLHVSSVLLASFIYLDEQRKKFPFFFLWAIAIALSTLTTKQHYVVDLITGFLLAIICYWVFHRYSGYRPTRAFLAERSGLGPAPDAELPAIGEAAHAKR